MNRLARESSPYLLQHANNPVDWFPWGPEAHEKAKREDKPIFLSIGYSACHWCHVMEHESFENEALARQMNEGFVCIKVDREERPDLDQIYMNAVQMMTGRGGWPMSVFLTPDLKPFYGGTYWPPSGRMGMPGFDQVLTAVSDAWRNRRTQVDEQAGDLTAELERVASQAHAPGELSFEPLKRAETMLERIFDRRNGGFGGAPKFPHPMDLRVLLRRWRRERRDETLGLVTLTLDKMAGGGMYDQLGGGFHRYSVDERWLVPHFEKMLYDNALLAQSYVEAFQATGNADYARIARETCDYVLREMTDAAGGFYSTQDADSEGEEGKFYVWTPAEIEAVLGAEAAKTFCYVYDVSQGGNFEGHNILNLPKTIEQCATVLGRVPADLAAEFAASRG
ncbi:MAG TPA: thioredoxin domain-containing protein, partial [Pirellulales bacterium]|nr:thioredoxin domain-containing protein [Pirellulales bacterium]